MIRLTSRSAGVSAVRTSGAGLCLLPQAGQDRPSALASVEPTNSRKIEPR